MGKRGPLPQPTTRSSHRKRPESAIAAVVQLPSPRPRIPTAPKGLLTSTRRSWRAFWTSNLANVVTEVHLPGLRRLFQLYDQRDRAWHALEAAMFVKGSVGQVRLNPAGDFVLRLEQKILRLENEFGLTPAAAARLGIDIGNAHRSLAELKRAAAPQQGVDPREHAISPDDPRLSAVELPGPDS